jgi:hypothetical protein
MECMWKLQMTVILIDLLILYQNQAHEKTEMFWMISSAKIV